MKNYYKFFVLAMAMVFALTANAGKKSGKQIAPSLVKTAKQMAKKSKATKLAADFTAHKAKHQKVSRTLKKAAIGKTATYTVTATNLKYEDCTDEYDSFGFVMYAIGATHTVELWVDTKQFVGTYSTNQVDLDYSYLHDGNDYIMIKSCNFTTTESSDGARTLKGTITGEDGNTYKLDLSYVKPVKSREESITIPDAELYDEMASYGYFEAAGFNSAGTRYVDVCINSNKLVGSYVTSDCDDYYTFVASIAGVDTVYYDLVDADITVAMQGTDKALITGKLLCQSEVDEKDVPEFTISMTCDVEVTSTGLEFDATDDDFNYNFTASDDIIVDTEYFNEYGVLYVDATSADGSTYVGLEFNVDKIDDVIGIPEGTYEINSTWDAGTVTASEGVDEDGYVIYSFAGTMDEDGYFENPMWFLVGGTVTVKNDNGKLNIVVDAVNSYGCEIKATIVTEAKAPKPDPVPGENLIANGSFETWTSDTQPTGWEGWQITDKGNTGGASLSQTTNSYDGTYACYVAGAEKNKRLSTEMLTLKAGTYYVQFYAKAADGTGAIKPGYATKQANGDAQYTYIYGDATVDLTSDWQKVLYSFKLEEKTDIAMVIMNYKNSGDCIIDAYQLWLEGSTPTPPIEGEVYSIDFTQGMDGWTIDDVNMPTGLTYVWKQDNKFGMKASAYVNKVNCAAESWIISPEFDFTKNSVTSAELKINHAVNYTKTPTQFLSVLASTDQRNWEELTLSAWPKGDSWDYIDATADLSKFAGKKFHIAFCYASTTSSAPTWEIKSVNVTASATPDVLTGDADEDGSVTVSDITAIAAYILGQNPSPFNMTNADVDGDKAITVTDITGTASIILGIK